VSHLYSCHIHVKADEVGSATATTPPAKNGFWQEDPLPSNCPEPISASTLEVLQETEYKPRSIPYVHVHLPLCAIVVDGQCYAGLAAQTWYFTDDNRIALQGQGQCLDLTSISTLLIGGVELIIRRLKGEW